MKIRQFGERADFTGSGGLAVEGFSALAVTTLLMEPRRLVQRADLTGSGSLSEEGLS
ncbi:hypothetical protein ABZ924_19865 [Streptomyces sp. NPDC046876]|uniref:hypothetical protein n=1 Tax=Streptomyces sp. NPDC046876 TaxID=3155616 RepID=UPI0033F7A8FA